MTTTEARKPSYWILLLPILLGVGTCGGAFFSLNSKVKDMPRVKVPGEGTVHLAAGEYVGFLESNSVIDGEVIIGNASVSCAITAADSGDQIPLEAAGSSTTYSMGSYSGQSVMSIDVPRSGDYVVQCTGSGMGALAFGTGLAWMIIIAVIAGLAGVIIAAFLGWRIRRRRRAFVAARSASAASAGQVAGA